MSLLHADTEFICFAVILQVIANHSRWWSGSMALSTLLPGTVGLRQDYCPYEVPVATARAGEGPLISRNSELHMLICKMPWQLCNGNDHKIGCHSNFYRLKMNFINKLLIQIVSIQRNKQMLSWVSGNGAQGWHCCPCWVTGSFSSSFQAGQGPQWALSLQKPWAAVHLFVPLCKGETYW